MTKRVPMQHKTSLPATIAEAIAIDEATKKERDASYREYLANKERFQHEAAAEKAEGIDFDSLSEHFRSTQNG